MGKVGRPKKVIRNPFVFTDKIKTKKLEVKHLWINNKKKNGETIAESASIDSEKNSFHISPDIINEYAQKGSSSSEISIILYILSQLYNLKEKVNLDPEIVSSHTGYTIPVCTRTYGRLVKKGIIKKVKNRSTDWNYWINPKFIFKGNRIRYIKEQSKSDSEFNSLVNIIDLKAAAKKEENQD